MGTTYLSISKDKFSAFQKACEQSGIQLILSREDSADQMVAIVQYKLPLDLFYLGQWTMTNYITQNW